MVLEIVNIGWVLISYSLKAGGSSRQKSKLEAGKYHKNQGGTRICSEDRVCVIVVDYFESKEHLEVYYADF